MQKSKVRRADFRPVSAAVCRPASIVMALLCALMLVGCMGYHVGPAKPEFLKDVHTLFIPAFRNNTLLPRLEGLVTDTAIKQFQQDGTYTIGTRETADAILNCTIEKVQRTPARSVTGNVLLTNEFELDLGVRYQLVDRASGRILDSGRTSGSTSFFVGNDVTQDERQAIPLAAEQMAVRLVSMLSEGF